MATGRTRGPASRPPRRPGGGRPRASARTRPRRPRRDAGPGVGGAVACTTAARPPHPSWRGAAVDRRVLVVRSARRSRQYVSQRGEIAELQDKVATQQQRRRGPARAGALARPGVRRAAGPASSCSSSMPGETATSCSTPSRPPAPATRRRVADADVPLPLVRAPWQSPTSGTASTAAGTPADRHRARPAAPSRRPTSTPSAPAARPPRPRPAPPSRTAARAASPTSSRPRRGWRTARRSRRSTT